MINLNNSYKKSLRAYGCAIAGTADKTLLSSPFLPVFKNEIENLLRRQIFLGYHTFLSGMTLGAELLTAGLVVKLRKEFPHIKLYCYLPCETQANHWPEPVRELYFDTLPEADEVFYLASRYAPGCYEECRRMMLQHASRLLSICGEAPTVRKPYTLAYAEEQGIEVVCFTLGDVCLDSPLLYTAQ